MTKRRARLGSVAGAVAALIVHRLAVENATGAVRTSRAAPTDLQHVDPARRAQYIRRAAVWHPTDIGALNLLAGPPASDGFTLDQPVTCDYVEPPHRPGGATPKFMCALTPADVVKVKYGRHNNEVYAEVIGTRLLWALGFGADRAYPVQVTCRNCPIEPWYWSTERRVDEKRYELATIERKDPGKAIEVDGREGWSWRELEQVDESAGGAPRAHRDALTLLAVFIQHHDSKAPNQRLSCEPSGVGHDGAGNETCDRPFMLVQDLGNIFGRSNFLDTQNPGAVNLAAWSRTPVWKDRERCVGQLSRSLAGTFSNPVIHEEGRRFLSDLLGQLSDTQLRDLFIAGRVERRGESIVDHGTTRPVTVADWVAAFKRKRDEVASLRCPD